MVERPGRGRRAARSARPLARGWGTLVAGALVLALGVGLGLVLGRSHAAVTTSTTGGTSAGSTQARGAGGGRASAGAAAAVDGDRAGDRAGASPSAGPAAAGAATTSAARPATAQVAALSTLLDQRAAALLHRDRAGWLAPLSSAPGSAAFVSAQAAVFDRLGVVPVTTWSWHYLGPGQALSAARARALPAGSWVARVSLSWGLRGAGSQPVRRVAELTVVPVGGGWALAGDEDGPTQVDLWDLGAVTVASSPRSIVLGTAPASLVRAQAPLVDAAAATVDATWGTGWPRVNVVEVPANARQLADLLSSGGPAQASTAGLDQLAAVTTGELVGAAGATTGDHVILNPETITRLGPLGQQVVLTHELTHVATRTGAVRSVPRWLSEGFADWIGYSASGLTRQQVAGDLLTTVRSSGPPADLPTDQAFDPAATAVGPAYSGAWLAVSLLAQRCGSAGLVTLYRRSADREEPARTSSEAAFEQALEGTCGLSREQLVQAWQGSLVALAAAP